MTDNSRSEANGNPWTHPWYHTLSR